MSKKTTEHWNKCHPIAMAAASARYRIRHPEEMAKAKLKQQKDYHTQRAAGKVKLKSGITIYEKAKLLATQGGKCKACGTSKPGSRKGWHTDHCHITGRVRGVLCAGCNVALGNVKDSTQRLCLLIKYLVEN